MVFNKKCLVVVLLVIVFGPMEAMKRKPEDVEESNKRRRLEDVEESNTQQKTECLKCPAAPKKKQSRGIFLSTAPSPVEMQYTKRMESAARKDSIEQAIIGQKFDATIGLLSSYSADVDRDIMDAIFNSKFSEKEIIQLYQQLQRDGVVNACKYKDFRTDRNLLHVLAERNYSALFYQVLLDCPNAQELVNATDDENNTVIHLTNSPAIIADAVRLHVDVNRKNWRGNTALHETAGNSASEKEKAAVLLRYGASLDVLNNMGQNPYENGGARNENLNPENSEAVAGETVKGISFGLGRQNKNITSHILGRSTGIKIQPSTANQRKDFWKSSSSSSSSMSGSNDYSD